MLDSSAYSQDCVEAFRRISIFAKQKKFEFISVDMYILLLTKTKRGKEILHAMGIESEELSKNIFEYIEENIPKTTGGNPVITIQLKQLLENAKKLSGLAKKEQVTEDYIFVALFDLDEDDCFILNYFESCGVTRFDCMNFFANGKAKGGGNEDIDKSKNYLNKYAVLLNKKVSENKIENIIGREQEINQMIEVLCQKKKNNPLLVGEAGVGKTALIEGLAYRIENDDVPEQIKGYSVYMLDLTAVLAGTKYRGDFEDRLKNIIKEATSNQNVILAIDEIHTLIGSGSGSGAMDGSNILKPALGGGEIKVIGATTYSEYSKIFEKESALNRRFKKIDVAEPSREEALKILLGLQKKYEEFHQVKYSKEAFEQAIDISVKYINDKFLPDKAFDLIDVAGSKAKLGGVKEISASYMMSVCAEVLKIPINQISPKQKNDMGSLSVLLKQEIFGQDTAIETMVDSIILSRARLNTKEKPVGSFLFAGPSGVGKTELAKQLAKNLQLPLIRFDMSEYMEKHAVSKFVGAPPGYIGYEQGGVLIEQIRKFPHSILLLDEIEKAHPDILNMLLQVMDYATLTDSNNKKANFKNVILIMTTNIGADQMSKNKIGFNKNSTEVSDRREAIKKHLSPEFYNRLDGVIQFNALNVEQVECIVRQHITKLNKILLEKNIIAIFEDSVIGYIVESGFDKNLGARPIERFIEQNIHVPLAKEMLFGTLENGGGITIKMNNSKITFEQSVQNNKIKKTRKSKETIEM